MKTLTDHPAYYLVSEHARALGCRIAGEVAGELARMHQPLLSGDDSGLTSVWSEVCVQVQGEESFFWIDYKQLILDAVLGRLQVISSTEREMMWLRTESGWDWLWDVVNAGDEGLPPHPGVNEDEIADWIYAEFVRDLAESDECPEVVRYLEGSSGDVWEDEDEECNDLPEDEGLAEDEREEEDERPKSG